MLILHRPDPAVKSSPSEKSSPSVPYAIISRPVLADPRLSPADKVVLLALQQWGWKAHGCFPSNGTIAESCGISSRSVKRSLATLGGLGFIRVDPTRGNPTGRVIVLLWMDDPARHPSVGQSVLPLSGPIWPTPPGQSGPLSNLVVVTGEETRRAARIQTPQRQRPEPGPLAPVLRRVVADSPVTIEAAMVAAEFDDAPPDAPAENPRGANPAVGAGVREMLAVRQEDPDPPANLPEDKPGPATRVAELRAVLAARGPDPIIEAEIRRLEQPPAAPPAAPPCATVDDLIRSLARREGLRGSAVSRAARALSDDLRDRERSWRYLMGLCERVWDGTLSPDSVLRPYDFVMAKLAAGETFRSSPAAYFAASVGRNGFPER